MLISAGLQYVFTSKSSFDLCRRRRPLSLLAPAGFKHNFPDMADYTVQYIMYGVIDKSATPAEPFQFLLPVVLLELAAASEALPLLLRLQQRHEARTPRHPLQRGARNSERKS